MRSLELLLHGSDCIKNNAASHQSMIIKLLDSMAMRLKGENNLSDVTWAFCETSQTFKRLFLSFFFEEIGQYADDIYIERERQCGNNRVDFFFEHDGQNYIIENKIDDRCQHFGEYDKAFGVKPERFGYIMNYNDFLWNGLSRKDYAGRGYQIRTWESFYDYLETAKTEEEMSEEEQKLILSYQTYLTNVCNIVKIKQPMKLSALSGLMSFFQLLNKKVLYIDHENFQVRVYINGRETKFGGNWGRVYPEDCVFGRFFSVTFRTFKRNKESYGWFGLYCRANDNPLLGVGFDNYNGWGQTVYKLIEPTLKEKDSEWYEDDGMLWFDMSEDEFKKLDSATSIEEQTELLQNFVCKALESVVRIYENSNQ